MTTRRSTSARIAQNRTRLSVGSPDTVKARLLPLIEATKADELMVTTMIFDHAARKRSYELLAKAFGSRDPLTGTDRARRFRAAKTRPDFQSIETGGFVG